MLSYMNQIRRFLGAGHVAGWQDKQTEDTVSHVDKHPVGQARYEADIGGPGYDGTGLEQTGTSVEQEGEEVVVESIEVVVLGIGVQDHCQMLNILVVLVERERIGYTAVDNRQTFLAVVLYHHHYQDCWNGLDALGKGHEIVQEHGQVERSHHQLGPHTRMELCLDVSCGHHVGCELGNPARPRCDSMVCFQPDQETSLH